MNSFSHPNQFNNGLSYNNYYPPPQQYMRNYNPPPQQNNTMPILSPYSNLQNNQELSQNINIPQRIINFYCIFIKTDGKNKQLSKKKVPIHQFPCTISGTTTPNINIKLPKTFDATFQIIKVDEKFFLWTNNTTQLCLNNNIYINSNDYIQLRSGDLLNIKNWKCEFYFDINLTIPSLKEQENINILQNQEQDIPLKPSLKEKELSNKKPLCTKPPKMDIPISPKTINIKPIKKLNDTSSSDSEISIQLSSTETSPTTSPSKQQESPKEESSSSDIEIELSDSE